MTEPVAVRLKWLPHGVGLPLPSLQTPQSAGVDLCAALDANSLLTLSPGMRSLVPCGFAMALPPGYEAQVRPRSGLAARHGLTILNSPGTIDADYRGEIKVIVINLGQESVEIRRGDRIAQMVIAPVVQPAFVVGEDLDATQRGTGGFGSTGRT